MFGLALFFQIEAVKFNTQGQLALGGLSILALFTSYRVFKHGKNAWDGEERPKNAVLATIYGATSIGIFVLCVKLIIGPKYDIRKL